MRRKIKSSIIVLNHKKFMHSHEAQHLKCNDSLKFYCILAMIFLTNEEDFPPHQNKRTPFHYDDEKVSSYSSKTTLHK